MRDYRYILLSINDGIAAKGKRPGFFIRTYGCQMNSRDSEKLSGLLTQLGYEAVKTQEEADLILYNTCCVRENAENKVFGHLSLLKHLKASKPGLIIAVCGCMTQQVSIAEKIRAGHPYINIVFGTFNRHRLPEFIVKSLEQKQIIDIEQDENLPELEGVPPTTREYRHKAGVNIMYGCNNYCSYCIVPYVRGPEKSRSISDILKEVQALVDDGVKEIMLLGQNVNSYASGGFPYLLRRVSEVLNLKRIRFMTSHPKDFSDELIDAVKTLPNVCKSVHLPLQSGSTSILKSMNRQYTKEEYVNLALRLKESIPGIGLSTDIIVGYPGETEEDFNSTLEVVRQVKFSGAFTFIYSKRTGTPAALREDTVPKNVTTERFERLTSAIYPILLERNESFVGQSLSVMVEDSMGIQNVPAETDAGFLYNCKGRADDNTLVHFKSKAPLETGQILPVLVTDARTFYVSGISDYKG